MDTDWHKEREIEFSSLYGYCIEEDKHKECSVQHLTQKSNSTVSYLVVKPKVVKHQLCAWRFCCDKSRTSEVGTEKKEESHAQGVFEIKIGNYSY